MYGLPLKTEQQQQLGKERVFAKFKVNTVDQHRFNADIATMYITNHVSEATVPALKPATSGKSIYVLTLNLKRLGCNRKNIELLAKMIPQNIVYALNFENQVQFVVYYEKLYATSLIPEDQALLKLEGYDMDEVWENLIKSIGGIEIKGENTLAEQVAIDEERLKLQNLIASTEEKAYKEKQPRRKMELMEKVKEQKLLLEQSG